jgi:hypothetical protein
MCLQKMVDEICMKKSGKTFHDLKHKKQDLPFLTRDKSLINKIKSETNHTLISGQNQGENELFDTIISNDDL